VYCEPGLTRQVAQELSGKRVEGAVQRVHCVDAAPEHWAQDEWQAWQAVCEPTVVINLAAEVSHVKAQMLLL